MLKVPLRVFKNDVFLQKVFHIKNMEFKERKKTIGISILFKGHSIFLKVMLLLGTKNYLKTMGKLCYTILFLLTSFTFLKFSNQVSLKSTSILLHLLKRNYQLPSKNLCQPLNVLFKANSQNFFVPPLNTTIFSWIFFVKEAMILRYRSGTFKINIFDLI